MTTERAQGAPTGVDTRRPVPVDVWVDEPGGWQQWPEGGGPTDLQDGLPQDRGRTWVIAHDTAGLLSAARLMGSQQRTVEALNRHLPANGVRRTRLHPGGDKEVLLTLPTVEFLEATRDVETGWVTALLYDRTVLTVEEGGAHVLATAARQLKEEGPRADQVSHPVLAALLHTLITTAADVEDDVGEAVAATEREVFSSEPAGDMAKQVYDLKREITEARRAIMPVGTVLPELIERLTDAHPEHQRPQWLDRVEVAVDRIDQHLDQEDSLLSDMLNVHLSQVSVQQNEDMRRISAWAAIIAVPTFIAGVYGMNVQHIPTTDWRYGFAFSMALMAASAVVLWFIFRRSGWWGPPRPRSRPHLHRSRPPAAPPPS
ncbi:CorA family divalent cation transporter [Georgenia faecalis]|uniref:CorA family divalent cation transporter n=1 Tax=Georgenia faecalis TaxID=2483799 RepID=A0ABV9DB22_9MICO|nr:CorA family divalent cation transporter [Georgenia faecalis]